MNEESSTGSSAASCTSSGGPPGLFAEDRERLLEQGWLRVERVLDAGRLAEALGAAEELAAGSGSGSRRGGIRDPLARSPRLREAVLGPATDVARAAGAAAGPGIAEPRPVRAILFDKTPVSNWLVPWHQDTTIAVAERVETDGFGPWSVKDGMPHVRPPSWVLESMVTVRVHLDPCGAGNGPLRVITGSHRHGLLSEAQVAELAAGSEEVVCTCAAGDAIVMRPLLLHASSKAAGTTGSAGAGHRRVLHLEFATRLLPEGLRFAST